MNCSGIFRGGLVVLGLVSFSVSLKAEILPQRIPPMEGVGTIKTWKERFAEISLASGKCKESVEQVEKLFTAYEAFGRKSAEAKTEKEENEINTMFGELTQKHLQHSDQPCSKRVFMGYMIAAISLQVPPFVAESVIQAVVGGIVHGSIKLLSVQAERYLVVTGLKKSIGGSAQILVDPEQLPPMATYFNPNAEPYLYINPRLSPEVLVDYVLRAAGEQKGYFKFIEDAEKKANTRLASF